MFTFSTTTPLASVLNDYSKYLDLAEQRVQSVTKTDITEKFNFAGHDPAGISVTTKDRIVTVSLTSEGKLVHRDDFRVPAGYDVDAMKADYKFGMLTVTIPRITTSTSKDTRSVQVNVVS
jgi:HSP20 family molecular chaperone IbpA